MKGLRISPGLSFLLVALLATPPTTFSQVNNPVQSQGLPTIRSLRVVALAGQGETNDLERGIMAPLVVQVLDQNGRPVEGADVVFRFPLEGPSAAFPGQKNSLSTRTNADGQAAATGWRANSQVGTFEVRITATRGNEMGETSIRMSNATQIVGETSKRRKRWWSSPWTKIAIAAGVAGAVTAIVLAKRDGDSTTPTITITPGSPSVGGPQ